MKWRLNDLVQQANRYTEAETRQFGLFRALQQAFNDFERYLF
jgi:hypothetical protein